MAYIDLETRQSFAGTPPGVTGVWRPGSSIYGRYQYGEPAKPTYVAPNVPTPAPVKQPSTTTGEITGLMDTIASRYGIDDLVTKKQNIYSDIKRMYEEYPRAKKSFREQLISGPEGEAFRKLQAYRSQLVEQIFADPSKHLADISDPNSENYIADPYQRMRVAGDRMAAIAKKLNLIKSQLEKEGATIDKIVDAWSDAYENDIISKKLDLDMINEVYNAAWKQLEFEESKRRWEEEQKIAKEKLNWQKALDWLKLQAEEEKEEEKSEQEQLKQTLAENIQRLKILRSKVELKGKYKSVLGKVASSLVGYDPEYAQYEALREALIAQIARIISGEKGVLTDRDIDRAKKMLPSLGETEAQARAKFKQLEDLVGGGWEVIEVK